MTLMFIQLELDMTATSPLRQRVKRR